MKPLLLRTLLGEETDRRPVWIMRQAGRCLPEYRALKERFTFEELCADPAKAAEVTLMPLRRFDLDAAIPFADLISPAAALGVDFRFDPGPIIAKPLTTAAEIRALHVPEAEEIAPEVAAAQRLIKPELKPDQALLGFAGAPFSLAAYLVEGRGKQGFPALRALLASDPATFGHLMATIAKLSARYLTAQHAAGCDAVQVFDSWGGLLSLADWSVHVRPHIVDLLEELRANDVPTIFFANDAPHLARSMAELPSDGLALCWRNDLVALRAELGPHTGPNPVTGTKALQGNLDPAILMAGPEATIAATRDFLGRMPRRGHIFNLGHGIMPTTPLESIGALIETVASEAGHGVSS
ncbi:MAG: uroporphyrinogen decarboxylase [Planctomycetes bacterium]|nr:uroporphyrinogen decarboxylase [Planctomycetota bacterium]